MANNQNQDQQSGANQTRTPGGQNTQGKMGQNPDNDAQKKETQNLSRTGSDRDTPADDDSM